MTEKFQNQENIVDDVTIKFLKRPKVEQDMRINDFLSMMSFSMKSHVREIGANSVATSLIAFSLKNFVKCFGIQNTIIFLKSFVTDLENDVQKETK